LCGNTHKEPLKPGLRSTELEADDAGQKEPIKSSLAGPSGARDKFILVKNDAQAFVGKIYRIGRLAVPATREDKFDDTFPSNRPHGIADTILCSVCFKLGVLDGFHGVWKKGLDFYRG